MRVGQFKLISWNILGNVYLDREDHSYLVERYPALIDWKRRCRLLCQKILSYQVELICLQEVDEQMKYDILAELKLHGFECASYCKKGVDAGSMVLYRKELFRVVQEGGTVLPTQTKNGVVAWAVLEYLSTGKIFFICSTHVHWQESLDQLIYLLKYLTPHASLPVILIGDFNCASITMKKEILPAINKDSDVFVLYEHESWTLSGKIGWRSIDQVIYTETIVLEEAQSFIGDQNNSYKSDLVKSESDITPDGTKDMLPTDDYPSDHLPLIITCNLK